jgi:ribosomal protein S11
MDSRVLRILAAAPLALVISACDVRLGNLAGRATDEWTRTYPLAAGGQVRIGNTNGRVEIEGIDGNTVEIRAERVARGVTDTAAQELLPRIEIKEDIRPDRVSVETARMSGIMFGASFEVRYHVRAPKSAVIDASNTNGLVVVSDISGKVRAHTTNGGVTGKGLSGGVDAAATNGRVNVELAAVGPDRITLRTTNGGVSLTVPESAKADVSAACTNGGISVTGVKLEISEQSRRRLEGKLNGGGTPIDLRTTNGGVRLRSKASADEASTEDSDVKTFKSLEPPKPPKPPNPQR